MEIICYTDDREKMREALQKFKDVKRIKAENYLKSLPPPTINKIHNRMAKTSNLRRCSEPVRRFLRLFRKRWVDKPAQVNNKEVQMKGEKT